MTALRILPPAAKYLKKLKDKKLREIYQGAIKAICENPSIGEDKHGDLQGVKGYDIFYNKTNYELAYTVEYVKKTDSDETDVVIVIMAGTRENFYDQVKRYWK